MSRSDCSCNWYETLCRIAGFVYKIMLATCAICLGVELVSVFVMVCGRFVFNVVPLWTDQLSLMALVWMSIISISLAFYDGSHMRVELLDMFASKKVINVLKYFSNVVVSIVSAMMISQGWSLFSLTKNVVLSGFHVSEGLFYIPLIVCGVTSIYMNIFCVIRRIKGEEK